MHHLSDSVSPFEGSQASHPRGTRRSYPGWDDDQLPGWQHSLVFSNHPSPGPLAVGLLHACGYAVVGSQSSGLCGMCLAPLQVPYGEAVCGSSKDAVGNARDGAQMHRPPLQSDEAKGSLAVWLLSHPVTICQACMYINRCLVRPLPIQSPSQAYSHTHCAPAFARLR